MRERWGTFSVRDHMTAAPFVSDVLLYDRLIIPVPDSGDHSAEEAAIWRRWQPEKLNDCLNILKVKTEKTDGLALTVPWDSAKRERFTNRMSTAAALATQQRAPEQEYYTDPFEMTRQLIKNEFLPALPPGVSKAWAVAAYGSARAFSADTPAADPETRRRRLAMVLTHRFLTPAGSDPKHELLKRAVDLAATDDFRRKRARFYEWQEEIFENDISDEGAIVELENRLVEYGNAVENAFSNVITKFVFTAIPIALTMTGAFLAGTIPALSIGAVGGLIQLARFYKFDRRPSIEHGDFDAAAMIYDARREVSFF